MERTWFWRRLFASIIDLYFVTILTVMFMTYFPNSDFVEIESFIDYFNSSLLWVPAWIYFAMFECSHFQATIGKMLLGLKVVHLNGERISFARATGRHFAKFLTFIPPVIFFAISDFFYNGYAIFHNTISECSVIKKED